MNLNRNALLKRAATSFQNGDLFNARAICQEVLAKNPNDIGAIEILARTEFEDQNLDLAVGLQSRLVQTSPKSVHMRLILGVMLTRMGLFEHAIREIGVALKLQPGSEDAAIALIDALEKSGDQDSAMSLLKSLSSANRSPDLEVLRARLAIADGRPSEAITILRDLEQKSALSAQALFALGKAYEKQRDGDQAFLAYSRAKQSNRPPFDLAKFLAMIDDIVRFFTAERVARLQIGTQPSEVPLFIAARPRSGTTLLSRILGCHPSAFDGGENGILQRIVRNISLTVGSTLGYPGVVGDLDQTDADVLGQAYLSAVTTLSSGAARVADKTLTNHLYAGLVQCILPRARMIWCRRNAVDNCLACFSEDFGWKHPYTHDITDLAVTHVATNRLMRHWQAVLKLPILEFKYEELVNDQEAQTRRLLEFCGLAWDERCLRFHDPAISHGGGAQTLSYQQVRKPLYKTSVGRAALFERHLGPMIEALGDES